MRANRRRQRKHDPLACPDAVRAIFGKLRDLLPDVIPQSEKQLIRMLNSVRNVERHPASDTRRGRPSRWGRADLIRVATHLRFLLDRETQGRVSLNSFISLYIRVLSFPSDVTDALIAEEINLFEASQLSRLTPQRLSVSSVEAKGLRKGILEYHLLTQGSEASLRKRVIEHLGEKITTAGNRVGADLGLGVVDDLVELDSYDTRHLFWEELRRISLALRKVTPDDIDDKILEDFLSASDHLSNVLARVEKRRQHRTQIERKEPFIT